MDADGHITDPAVADVLGSLIRRDALLRYLGSYPRMRGESVPPPEFAATGRYDAAAAAVGALLTGAPAPVWAAPGGANDEDTGP